MHIDNNNNNNNDKNKKMDRNIGNVNENDGEMLE